MPRNARCCIAKRVRKFDSAIVGRRAALAEVTDPERLAQVGDWIIECGTAAELFARLADTPRRNQ